MDIIETKIIKGDCLEVCPQIPENSVDLIFADPPYNLSGDSFLTVQNGKPVKLHKGKWDEVANLHEFNLKWIEACKRLLKPHGTLWITGTLHNHPSVGVALKEVGLWIINDLIWYKPNATPLLSRNRFVPSTELIWVASKTKKYYFDYELAKKMNNGKQMRNLWVINAKRHVTKHPTEKPEELLERIILMGSKPGDLVLDPFLGSGTTAVVALKNGRNSIGIELEEEYIKMTRDRLEVAKMELKRKLIPEDVLV